jgi:hypothetical protein
MRTIKQTGLLTTLRIPNRKDAFMLRTNLILSAILTTAIGVATDADAKGNGKLQFRYTAHDSCMAAPSGTFTADGDVTGGYGNTQALGSGVMTFDFSAGSVTDENKWAYQVSSGFFPPPNGSPLGIYPQRTTNGICVSNVAFGPGLSFTLTATSPNSTDCTTSDAIGPGVGTTVTFLNRAPQYGQFSEDMQSFVIYSNDPHVETLTFANGGQVDRVCMREYHGVRIPK